MSGLKTEGQLADFLQTNKRTKKKGGTKTKPDDNEEMSRLMVEEFNDIKKQKVPSAIVRDGKRMEKLL